VTETKAKSSSDCWSIAAALFAGKCNLLSLILTNYQIGLFLGRPFVLNYPEIVSECIWLAPLLVVIVFRHIAVITFGYALTLFIILVGRIYYLFGIGAFEPKVDWPAMLLNFLDAASLLVLLVWLLARSVILIGITFKKWKEGSARIPDERPHGRDIRDRCHALRTDKETRMSLRSSGLLALLEWRVWT
jgi:hypothetical protein